jgi:propanediol utilization protein
MIWIFSIGSAVIMGIFLWAVYKLRQTKVQEAVNHTIYLGLQELHTKTQVELKKNAGLIAQAKSLITKQKNSEISGDGGGDLLSTPEMLATVITTIVAKSGTIRLSLSDFDSVDEGAYVSVYIDTGTQDLILSLKHDLAVADSYIMSRLVDSGSDDTYH